MLKINAKLGGKNWELPAFQDSTFTPITGPFMVFGIDVTHPSIQGNTACRTKYTHIKVELPIFLSKCNITEIIFATL